jgi:3-phenylpropionate/trans-cinnamate dioxygenase ferredoxin component
MARFIEVAKTSQIPEHGVIGVEIEGKSLALVKLKGTVFVFADTCPHAAGPLSEGQVIGEDIECPWHRSCFNVRTGRVTRDPAMQDIETYTVRVVGDVVEVEI